MQMGNPLILKKKLLHFSQRGRLESFRMASARWMKVWALPSQRSWWHKESGELNLMYQSQGVGWVRSQELGVKCVEGGRITHSA